MRPAGGEDQINAIKLNEAYQKSEATADTESLAIEDAFLYLFVEVNRSRMERGLDSIPEKNLRPFAKSLSYQRSSRFKGFSYVSLAEVDAFRSGIPFGGGGTQQAATVPAASVPAASVPAASVPATAAVQTPAPQSRSNFPISPTLSKSQVIMYLSAAEVGSEAFKALGEFKQKGQLADFGKITSRDQLNQSNYLLIINQRDEIQAVLEPKDNNAYHNLGTDAADNWTNYHGCGIVWFRF